MQKDVNHMNAETKCWICQPFGSGPTCEECAKLSTLEREAKLTDTLIAEILEEEQQSQSIFYM